MDQLAVSEAAAAIVQHCRAGGSGCDGMPPYSCKAFSPRANGCDQCFFVINTADSDKCLRCQDDRSMFIFYISVLPAACMLGLGLLAWVMVRHPEMISGSLCTISIIYSHAQTFSVFVELHIRWPPTVLPLMKYLSINLFLIEIGRPECLIGEAGVDERLGGTWYLINTMKLTATTTLFLLLLISSL